MGLNNKTCPKCGKKFHHCSSCDTWGEWWLYQGYCSKKCWLGSEEYLNDKEIFLEFYSTLNPIQMAMFDKFLEIVNNEYYEFHFEGWIEEYKKEEKSHATP